MSDFIFYSFHTADEYYAKKGDELRACLSELGIPFHIEKVDIPEGKTWPDLCRQKIKMIYDFCELHVDKKVFWIDADCVVSEIPYFVKDFSADVIGFQRGFGNPMKIGYSFKARFWEPCFIGINNTPMARKFIADAHRSEQLFNGSATDDYFFEESWRKNCQNISYQIIPSKYAVLKGRKKLSEDDISPFFFFGASGNVKEFKGKVSQHTAIYANKDNSSSLEEYKQKIRAKLSRIYYKVKGEVSKRLPHNVKANFKKIKHADQIIDDKTFKIKAISGASAGNDETIEQLIISKGGRKNLSDRQGKIIEQAGSISSYLSYGEGSNKNDVIDLAWWINPEPGNFGDWLSPYIFSRISNRSVQYVSPQKRKIESPHYFSVGSIGKFTQENSIVMGTGISRKTAELNPAATYLSVRGPRTRDRVIACGGKCPDIFGDPAILMPLLYQPKALNKKGKVALVRHFTHKSVPVKLPENVEELNILCSTPGDIERFIDRLCSYDYVLSTAMHAFIICQAYNIPCGLVNFEGLERSVHGDGMKYFDYFEGVSLRGRKPEIISPDLMNRDLSLLVTQDEISKKVILDLESLFKDELILL